MKKLLALVLALVMSMSLVTISNAAFKDADKIDYKEAVDVMNAVGVFIGDEKGNFNAKENLTREQAAKIIAYLELGSKAADALVGGATFTDVAASRWSAGFVGDCAQAGVVAGYDGSRHGRHRLGHQHQQAHGQGQADGQDRRLRQSGPHP